jgi:protein gp37
MKRSKIEWCDYSGGYLNFIRRGKAGDCGCSPACAHCYALRIGERFGNLPDHTTIYPDRLEKLERQKFPQDGNRRGPGSKPLAFVCDTGDIAHPLVPDGFIWQAMGVMAGRDDVDWLVLTKRAERMRDLLKWARGDYIEQHGPRYAPISLAPAPNIWHGATICNQPEADRIVPVLLDTPAAM